MKSIIIEQHNDDSVEWGVSIKGPNPDPKDYFCVDSKDTAIRLNDYINKMDSDFAQS